MFYKPDGTMTDRYEVISAEGLTEDIDFEVVDDSIFYKETVSAFVYIPNHEIDIELAHYLGLGVVRYIVENGFEIDCLYSMTDNKLDPWYYDCFYTRMDIYHQITHPNDYNESLEKFLFWDDRAKAIMNLIHEYEGQVEITYSRLREIYHNIHRGLANIPRIWSVD